MSREFDNEAEMCRAFISAVPRNWLVLPETGKFDILLVRKQDGFQIGIQAKLRLNDKVIAQAAEGSSVLAPGPDCRAVLVQPGGLDLGEGRFWLALTIIRMFAADPFYGELARFHPPLPELTPSSLSVVEEWFELFPAKRLKLPDYMPDVEAGARSPVQLTRQKIGAIKLAIMLQRRGLITRADFSRHGVDIRQWLKAYMGRVKAGPGGFVAGPGLPDFKAQHPVAFAEIEADYAEWSGEAKLQDSFI